MYINQFQLIRMIKLIKIYLAEFSSRFVTIFVLIECYFDGINLGQNCKFYGFPKFTKNRKSNIFIGENCTFRSSATSNLIGINHPCIISAIGGQSSSIIIGSGSGFSGSTIGAFYKIEIGKNVKCGANTLITDGDWHDDDPRSSPPKQIKIEDNVWLGVNVVVLKGVHIGRNTFIGANSVVTRDIPENVLAAGNPCRIIRPLSENEIANFI